MTEFKIGEVVKINFSGVPKGNYLYNKLQDHFCIIKKIYNNAGSMNYPYKYSCIITTPHLDGEFNVNTIYFEKIDQNTKEAQWIKIMSN